MNGFFFFFSREGGLFFFFFFKKMEMNVLDQWIFAHSLTHSLTHSHALLHPAHLYSLKMHRVMSAHSHHGAAFFF